MKGLLILSALAGTFIFLSSPNYETPSPQVKGTTFRPTLDEISQEVDKVRYFSLDPALMASAQIKCLHMQKENYWAHTAPDGTKPWVFFPKGRSDVGENLATNYSSTQSLVKAWLDSPKHYHNIMNPEFKKVGYGICDFRNTYIVVQHFSD